MIVSAAAAVRECRAPLVYEPLCWPVRNHQESHSAFWETVLCWSTVVWIENDKILRQQKVAELLGAIETKILLNSQNLYKFVEELEKDSSTSSKELCDKLKSTRGECVLSECVAPTDQVHCDDRCTARAVSALPVSAHSSTDVTQLTHSSTQLTPQTVSSLPHKTSAGENRECVWCNVTIVFYSATGHMQSSLSFCSFERARTYCWPIQSSWWHIR